MHDSYKMVLVSAISFLLIIIGIGIYRFIYPKKRINSLILVLLLSLPPLVSIFRPGTYESGDFDIHIYRTISFYNSLIEGHLLPSWAGQLNATYGYPLFIFNYPLPYYLISFFHVFGFSFILSMKFFLASTFIISAIAMYYAARQLFKNDFASFTAAIFYQFAPYHLIDEHFKIVIGELLVFCILPLCFLFLLKLLKHKTFLLFVLTSLAFGLLIQAHVVITLLAMLLLFCYILFSSIDEKTITPLLLTIGTFIVSSIYTLYIWLTPFFLSQYTILHNIKLEPVDSIPLWQLLYSPYRLGFLFQGPHGEISNLIGYTQAFILLLFIYLLFAKKITHKYVKKITFWVIAAIILIFLITSYANTLWNLVPLIGVAGSHRLLILVAFCISILAGYVSTLYPKKKILLYTLCFITIFTTILNWGQRRVIPQITDAELINTLPLSTAHGEGHYYANSVYRTMENPWFSQIPTSHLQILEGIGKSKEIVRNSTEHTYVINAQTNLSLRENTLYFPGWHITSDAKQFALGHDTQGVITFTLPKGLHYVDLSYSDLPIYKEFKIVSVSSFLLALGLIIWYLFKRFSRKNQ